MNYIGIDPGKSGAIACIGTEGADVISMPYLPKQAQPQCMRIVEFIREHSPCVAVLESVNAFGMGRQSAFVFGQGLGAIYATLQIMGVPFMLARPVQWQKVALAGLGKGGERAYCERRWPEIDWPRNKKTAEGWADALCIASYCQKQEW